MIFFDNEGRSLEPDSPVVEPVKITESRNVISKFLVQLSGDRGWVVHQVIRIETQCRIMPRPGGERFRDLGAKRSVNMFKPFPWRELEYCRVQRFFVRGRSITLNRFIVHSDSSGERQSALRSHVKCPRPERQRSHWKIRWID
jgi:hypothetical protein